MQFHRCSEYTRLQTHLGRKHDLCWLVVSERHNRYLEWADHHSSLAFVLLWEARLFTSLNALSRSVRLLCICCPNSVTGDKHRFPSCTNRSCPMTMYRLLCQTSP